MQEVRRGAGVGPRPEAPTGCLEKNKERKEGGMVAEMRIRAGRIKPEPTGGSAGPRVFRGVRTRSAVDADGLIGGRRTDR